MPPSMPSQKSLSRRAARAFSARVRASAMVSARDLGDRDHDLVEQYAEIFDALPPIEINQDKEIIDGWHRYLAARRVDVAEIACVVIQTTGDDDLADRMWEANRKHGVQYSRGQRKAYGVKLHGRRLAAKEIADRAGVGVNTVYRWTKELREKARRERDKAVLSLAGEGKTQQQVADELGVPQRKFSDILSENPQMVETAKAAEPLENTEPQAESEPEPLEDAEPDIPDNESEEKPEARLEELSGEPQPEPETNDVPTEESSEREAETQSEVHVSEAEEVKEGPGDEQADEPEPEEEPPPPESIPTDILKTARAVLGAFAETRPDGYVARLEASEGEWMTITDDS